MSNSSVLSMAVKFFLYMRSGIVLGDGQVLNLKPSKGYYLFFNSVRDSIYFTSV